MCCGLRDAFRDWRSTPCLGPALCVLQSMCYIVRFVIAIRFVLVCVSLYVALRLFVLSDFRFALCFCQCVVCCVSYGACCTMRVLRSVFVIRVCVVVCRI